jgi:hypothetical protein
VEQWFRTILADWAKLQPCVSAEGNFRRKVEKEREHAEKKEKREWQEKGKK